MQNETETFSYLLKSVREDMTGYGGFKYPESGVVEPHRWDPVPTCADGIFGFLDGCGDGTIAKWFPADKWLVLKVNTKDIVSIDGGAKAKVPRAEVVFVGDVFQATSYLESVAPHTKNMPVIGANRAQGAGSVIVGYRGVATAGYEGTATAGDGGTAAVGEKGQAVAGGDGTATAGYRGVATAGHRGTATAGDFGTATAGCGGTAVAGFGGRVKGGPGAVLKVAYRDDLSQCWRVVVAYVGQNGILANTFYECFGGKMVEAEKKVEAVHDGSL